MVEILTQMLIFFFSVVLAVLGTAFFMSVVVKFGWLNWLQIHAPNEWLGRLFNCKFCTTFWAGLLLCLIVAIVSGYWLLLAAPIFSTIIARELW